MKQPYTTAPAYRVEHPNKGGPVLPVVRWLCRFDGCQAGREPGALFCAEHWKLVDPELRAAYTAQQIALRAAAVKCLRSARGEQP